MKSQDRIEELSSEIHKLYCKQFLKEQNKPYWTEGNYLKLDEETKEYDRNIARFIIQRDLEKSNNDLKYASIKAMQGLLENPMICLKKENTDVELPNFLQKISVELAKRLLKQLNEETKNEKK